MCGQDGVVFLFDKDKRVIERRIVHELTMWESLRTKLPW